MVDEIMNNLIYFISHHYSGKLLAMKNVPIPNLNKELNF